MVTLCAATSPAARRCFVGYFCLAAGEGPAFSCCPAAPSSAIVSKCACRPPRLPVLLPGVSLASGVQVATLSSWAQLANADALLKLAPALAMVACIILVMHKIRWGCPGTVLVPSTNSTQL